MTKVKYSNVSNKNLGGERYDKLLESGIKSFKMSTCYRVVHLF